MSPAPPTPGPYGHGYTPHAPGYTPQAPGHTPPHPPGAFTPRTPGVGFTPRTPADGGHGPGGFTPRSATPGSGPGRPGASSSRRHPQVGQSVGRYTIVSELGRGGMGVVYRARDPELGRDVAIKMILDLGRVEGHGLERLHREARAAAKLSHPAIVSIHEAGEEDGLPYLVMDFIEGETLDAAVGRERFAPRRAAAIVRDLAEALDHAHAQGIVHRDVKPQNVIIDRSGDPHLVDFGLAQLDDHRTKLTRTGQLVGTPQYLSPEQARGDRPRIGPLSDVFALGGLLYFALLGRPPFEGETVIEVLGRLFHEEPEAPRRIDPTVHPDLETIALRCLEKEQARRYASAGEVASELRRFLDGDAIVARPSGRARRAWRWARRHPVRVVAMLFVGLVALALPGAAIAHGVLTSRERERAARAAREAIADRIRSEVAAARATFDAAREAADRDDGAGPELRHDRLDVALAAGLEAFAAGHRLEAIAAGDDRARRTLYEVAVDLGELALRAEQWSVAASAFDKAAGLSVDDGRARALHRSVDDARERVDREHRAVVIDVLDRARSGRLGERTGDYEDALFALVRYPEEQTVELIVGALEPLTRRLREAAMRVFVSAAEPTEAEARAGEERLPHLRAAVQRWLEQEPGWQPDQETIETLLIAQRRIEQREARRRNVDPVAYSQPALTVIGANQERALGPAGVMLARLCCEALGRIGLRSGAIEPLGRYLTAEQDQVRAARAGVALCLLGGERAEAYVLAARDRFNVNGPFWRQVARYLGRTGASERLGGQTAQDFVGRGISRMSEGDLDGALEDLTRAIEIDAGLVMAWNNRGMARFQKGDLEGAIADFTRAIELEPGLAAAFNNRGNARRDQGDLRGAVDDYTRCIEITPSFPGAWANRAVIRRGTGDLEGALSDASRALSLDPRDGGLWAARANIRAAAGDVRGALEDLHRAVGLDPRDPMLWSNLANARAASGDLDGAVADYSRAIEIAPRDPVTWFNRGHTRMVAEDFDGAEADFSRAIELDPKFAMAWNNRGYARIVKSEWESARADIDRSLALDPGYPGAWHNRGMLRARTGDLDGAIADFTACIEREPRHPWALFHRGMALADSGRRDEAAADLRRVLQLVPDDPRSDQARARLREMGR